MTEKIARSDAEWRRQLTDQQYKITRKAGTERPFSGPHQNVREPGMFRCVCCGEPLFETATKFDSGTGWPSFHSPTSSESVGEREDRSLFMRRTEAHCARCDAHLGHVFPDGPEPTGLRYCINGHALTFEPETG